MAWPVLWCQRRSAKLRRPPEARAALRRGKRRRDEGTSATLDIPSGPPWSLLLCIAPSLEAWLDGVAEPSSSAIPFEVLTALGCTSLPGSIAPHISPRPAEPYAELAGRDGRCMEGIWRGES
eukprot:352421-Chlamydomonas_euryale.AAC.76